ncbi:sensor histidine kinase [Natribacillus halophilus]|uniref:histidine kinase n=1 Tax=Natribacillus halophilus TaxID=549003 RepID=A0A1G8KTB8_9BACI|nr:sensor histidine kinase [Natribacillus halophilus]SDI46664.1 Signal transduction histidine kinase [Natribacillus halophilus]
MGKVIFILTFLYLFIVNAETTEGKSEPAAEQGHISFDQWSFQQDGFTHLDGEWEFYWQQLLEPADFGEDRNRLDPYYMEVPHAWYQSDMDGESLPHEGYATYRVTMDLHEDDQDQLMSIYLPRVYSAHKIWVNGERLYEQGVVGESRSEMHPDENTQALPFQVESDSIEVVLQVSNFTQRAGGIWDSMYLGTETDMTSYLESQMTGTLFFVGSLIMIGCVFICFYLFRRKDRAPLYFGLLCIAIGVQTYLQGGKFFSLEAPYWNWELRYKLEYLANTAALGSFALFVHNLYPQEMKRRVRQIILLFCSSYGLFVAVTPPHIFSYTMLFFQLAIIASLAYIFYAFIKAAIRRRSGISLHIIGFSVLFVTLIFDILYYNQRVAAEETLLNYGMFFYIFMQSLHLAKMFAGAYTRVEELSSELLSLNVNLEEKVKARTQTIHEKEALRRRMMTNISHELSTPLSSIRGYIRGMLDGVFRRRDDRYMELVYDKTLLLERIVGDLHDLSKLENQQISFVYEKVNIHIFVRRLYEKYETEINESGQRLDYNDSRVHDMDVSVRIDPDRIEQAFANLLFNAARYSAANGTINVELDTDEEYAVISIIDAGSGIEDEELPFLFDRFYKKTSEEGFGIGLTICKEIIDQHDGDIGVESSVGVGSRFYFKLPVQ